MPRANYSTSMANIFGAHARNLHGGGARRGGGAGWGGAAGICAQGQDREVDATYGCWEVRATHEKRPIAGVLHVAQANTNNLGVLRVIDAWNHKIE